MANVWTVDQWRNPDGAPEQQGVFSTEEKAIAACRSEMYFITPFTMDEEIPDEELSPLPEAWFPLAEPRP